MGSNSRLYLILGVLALLLVAVIMALFEFRPVVDASWDKTYQKESHDPYGSWLFHELLGEVFPSTEIIEATPQRTDSTEHNLYVRIADIGDVGGTEMDSVLEFVRMGNDAFIISNTFGGELDSLISEDYYTYGGFCHKTLEVNLGDMSYYIEEGYSYINYNLELDTSKSSIRYTTFAKIQFDSLYEGEIAYEMVSEKSIMIEIPYGDNGGKVYLCSAPILFTNISLQQPDMALFFEGVMAVIDTPTKIYWDDTKGKYIRNYEKSSPLKYILSEKSLRLAYYLTLGLGFIFLIFRSRRKQKVIPLLSKNKNTSLEYISTISKLYQGQEQHEKLVVHLERIFYHNVEKQYFISKEHPDFVSILAKKSRSTEEDIGIILERFDNARGGMKFSDYQLEKITQRIDKILHKKS